MDAAVDHVRIRRLDAELEPQIRPWRLGATVLGTLGVLATLISLAGSFAVLSYLVVTKQREIGVRMALGASEAKVRGLVVRRALGTAAVGLVVGGVLVALGSRWLGPLLFETQVADPAVWAAVALLTLATATVASVVPASRASRVDPAESLRAGH